jgi:hypothetical protein
MNREIKFKAKNFDNDWIKGHYLKIHNMSYMATPRINYVIDPSTLCQLITKINDVEIYEYDCFVVRNKLFYGYYDEQGELILKVVRIDAKDYQFVDKYIEYDFTLFYMYYSSKANIIGNWHDGEQYLLNKIKEVENEN